MYHLDLSFRHIASWLELCADGSFFVRPSAFAIFNSRPGPVQEPVCMSCECGCKPNSFSWSGLCVPLWCRPGLRNLDPHWGITPIVDMRLKEWYTYNVQCKLWPYQSVALDVPLSLPYNKEGHQAYFYNPHWILRHCIPTWQKALSGVGCDVLIVSTLYPSGHSVLVFSFSEY